MNSVKKVFLVFLLSVFFVSSESNAQSFNLQSVIDAILSDVQANAEKDLAYKESVLKAFAKNYQNGQTFNFDENPKDAVNAIRALNKVLKSLNLPSVNSNYLKLPAYVYKGIDNPKLLDMSPINYGVRCGLNAPNDCYQDQPNANTSRELDENITIP
ncbi:MAG: hypothetical protein SFT90_03985 [Rickettsiales bacterium]|nr:hypothetical protein [Rickettsiales bacterium]